MKPSLIIIAMGLVTLGFFYSCSKNANPSPPVHDTTIVVKTDTITVPPPPDSTVNLKLGLLLYLPFDGNIADSSGNGNPTTAIGGNVLAYDAHGYANNAFGGNGAGQRIKVTNNGSIKFDTAFSLSFDFMINAPARQSFVTMVNTADGTGPSFIASASVPGLQNLDFYANDVSSRCDTAGTVNAVEITDTTAYIPQPGSWYNMICIYHKGATQTYVNGQLIGSKKGAGTAALLCPTAQIVIGGWWDGESVTLNGKLDEVRLYNRVLTPHEIVTLAQHFQVTSESTGPKLQHLNPKLQ
jgi:Concanavalin A-like lectin/glucanases superfamily